MPEKYKYRENIPLDKVVEILTKKEIEVTALEVHYNGKAIGVHIKYPDGDEFSSDQFNNDLEYETCSVGLKFFYEVVSKIIKPFNSFEIINK